MGRSRYSITDPDKPHFMTCTVLEWLPIFTRTETVQILLDCWRYSSASFYMGLPGLANDDVEGSMFIVVNKSLFWSKHRAQYAQTRHSGMDCRNLVAMDGNANATTICRDIGYIVV